MISPVLAVVAVACFVAAAVWGRSARHLRKVWRRVEGEVGPESDVSLLARSAYLKELHATLLYMVLFVAAAVAAAWQDDRARLLTGLVIVPVVLSVVFGRDFIRNSRIAEGRYALERRAEEVLSQEELAPVRWAARLAPEDLPDITGFEIGRVYQAGVGAMAGDFFDVFRVAPTRVVAAIGDVTGHGIDASITAFQAKYLLRVFLHQYRDPAQALEQLNQQMSTMSTAEELISMCVIVFDTEAGTLRFASAGHPAAWLWHDREVRPLRSTGPLVMLDPNATIVSREIPLDVGDLVLLYTDGLAEARSGGHQFGEERIANVLRRDPGVDPGVLCKSLLEAARDFASGPIIDDVAILAVRRS